MSASNRQTLVVLTDSAGKPKDSIAVGDWTMHAPETLRQLVVAAYPAETVLGVEWATEPARYSPVASDVLLARCAGVVARETVAPRKRAPRRERRDELLEHDELPPVPLLEALQWGANRAHERKVGAHRQHYEAAALEAQREASGIVNVCPCCGTSYTAETWAALPLAGAKEVEEANTVITEEYRQCGCGSTRMIFRTRARAA